MSLPNIIQQINSKLSLSGGQMTGNLALSNMYCNKMSSSTTWGVGTTWNDAPSISLYGPNETSSSIPNCFSIRAGANKYALTGKPDGTLIWGGNNVITSAGGDINGVIRLRNGSYIARSFSNENTSGASELAIAALSDTSDPYTGASIYLHDINDTRGNSQGGFFIYARNTKAKECGLCGYTDGTLTWNNKNVVCVTTWNSGTSWYRKYSDGWIEQGGSTYLSSNPCNLTFHLTFSNTNYTFVGYYRDIDDNAKITGCAYRTKYTSYIRLVQGYNGTSYPDTIMWYACGY